MDFPVKLWKQPITMADIKSIIGTLQNMDPSTMDKQVFITLLQGFKVIVDTYENQNSEINNENNQELILDWMRLYLNLQALVSSSEALSKLYLSTVPTAITYHIGFLLNVTNVSPKFYKKYMKMLAKLISRTDKGRIKKLEECGRGLIEPFWEVIDKVGNFENQMLILKIIYLILRNFNANSALFEILRISNINASIQQKLVDLLKISREDILYQKLSREILHQYNMGQGSSAAVNSFFCQSFTISDQLSFAKLKHCDHFWFDINTNPHTLTFQGLFISKSSNYDENVEVTLDINNYSCISKDKIKIEFKSPSFIWCKSSKELTDLKTLKWAYATLNNSEMNRFKKIFKVNTNDKNENSSQNSYFADSSVSKNEQFKKPSLEQYESAVRITKPKNLMPQETSSSDFIKKNPISTPPDLTEISAPSTDVEKRRFFKNPRQPKKIEIPWKLQSSRNPYSTSNRKKGIQKVHPIQPVICAVRESGKEFNINNENLAPYTASNKFEVLCNGPSTSIAAATLKKQINEKNIDEKNINRMKTSSECRSALNSFTIRKVENSIATDLLNKKEYVKATEPESMEICITTNLEAPQQNANDFEVNDESKKRKCTFLKRKIEGAVSDSDFKTSSDEDHYPKRKRLVKRRRTNSKKVKT